MLEQAANRYGWPAAQVILDPPGAGPARHVQVLRQKLEGTLRRRPDAARVRVGLLTRDPDADATEDPLAVVCEFPTSASSETLLEAHRLAWSFSRAPVLLIVEPGLLRVWTCCEPPSTKKKKFPAELSCVSLDAPLPTTSMDGPPPTAAMNVERSLEWIRFTAGALTQAAPERFNDRKRANRTLLENCRVVRRELLDGAPGRPKLSRKQEIVHDLLARVIFIQFLFHRTDPSGRPILSSRELSQVIDEGLLEGPVEKQFAAILRSRTMAYALFRWLDERFNGDLFPGKRSRGGKDATPEQAWAEEMRHVRAAHLEVLADLVEGRLILGEKGTSQLHLWPLYAFDVIPLDFISSIYEELVGEGRGVHYTPHYLVDFVLDEVLPWHGDEWDVRLLDPSCGSGIFLVKAFQRLVHRWRATHPGESPTPELLRRLLERNLVGVDIDDDAVKVASLSLYLAMCDELDHKSMWQRVRLPSLYGSRLIHADFFEATEESSAFAAGGFDLVVGNAPWGEDTASPGAEAWAKTKGWALPNGSIGPLFLPRAAGLVRPGGYVAMLQPAGTLLFNRSQVVCGLRRRLFESYEVEEIIDFSAVRRDGFKKSVAQVCAVVLQPGPPDSTSVLYARARECDGGSRQTVVIESSDVHHVEKLEAMDDPWIWSVLWHGTRRDLELVHKLRRFPLKLGSLGVNRMGIVRGSDPAKLREEPRILKRRFLETPTFPESTFLVLDATTLKINRDPRVTRRDSTDFSAFASPQLLFKFTWTVDERRFRAVIVDNGSKPQGVICTQSYLSVHVKDEHRVLLESACLTANSSLAVYFLHFTGSRFSGYRPNALNQEARSIPLAGPWQGDLGRVRDFEEVDREVARMFRLTEIEQILIRDYCATLDPKLSGGPPDLLGYADQLVQMFAASGLATTAVIVEAAVEPGFPLCVLVLYLRRVRGESIRVERTTSEALRDMLLELNRRYLQGQHDGRGGVLFHRVARIYDLADVDGEQVPAAYLIKPNRWASWSRSAAINDADAMIGDALGAWPLTDGGRAAAE